jgi:hypothetical protein
MALQAEHAEHQLQAVLDAMIHFLEQQLAFRERTSQRGFAAMEPQQSA